MDFDAVVKAAINAGASAEDIAREFTTALNKAQQEVKKPDKRTEYLNNLDMLFHEHYANEHLGIHDVTALAVLVLASNYPKWTVEDMQDFRANVAEGMISLADFQTKGIDAILESFRNLFYSTPEKSGEVSHDEPNSCKINSPRTPLKGTIDERLAQWLESLK